MKYFKTELKNDYEIKFDYISASFPYIKKEMEKGRYSGYIPTTKLQYNLDVTFEEFDAEYKRTTELVKDKVKEIGEYFNTFKGKRVNKEEFKYDLNEYGVISNKLIAELPEKIADEKAFSEFKKALNFKRSKDTIYINEIYLVLKDDAGYYTDTFEFNGLSDKQLIHAALSLAIYNKIGKICDFDNATQKNYQKVLDQEITLNDLIENYLVIRD